MVIRSLKGYLLLTIFMRNVILKMVKLNLKEVLQKILYPLAGGLFIIKMVY